MAGSSGALEFRDPRNLLISLITEGWEEPSQEGFLQEEGCRGGGSQRVRGGPRHQVCPQTHTVLRPSGIQDVYLNTMPIKDTRNRLSRPCGEGRPRATGTWLPLVPPRNPGSHLLHPAKQRPGRSQGGPYKEPQRV